ncbi:hypothetical protein HJC23_008459 [Cyclotella cryptica]|uniref:Uncharacterized protein n=1 Tax=Cyclotella cryptica TaxID=29204 RepID=A0ABD3QXB4_9STRA|eukprot:CCRYP_001183-RA/>CCRYP_001183-RA protein AED:0.05 eAED:0.05 QI:0/-1/0/1/-1/1/1/0/696
MTTVTSAAFTAALLLTPLLSIGQKVFCPISYQECSNGLFNPDTCACECIPPFCPDTNGDCSNPTGYCGGNPWQNCQRGVDCPWWPNPLKAESCMTGNSIPPGIWKIYRNLEYCCSANFPYSQVCPTAVTVTTSPPTIRPPSPPSPQASPVAGTEPSPSTTSPAVPFNIDTEYETIPLKLSLVGLTSDIPSIRDFKDAMMEELKNILTELASSLDMTISEISENYGPTSNSRALQSSAQSFASNPTQAMSLYYDVSVVRNPGERYARILIQAIQDRHGELLSQIQEYTDNQGYGYISNFDMCTTSSNVSDPKEDSYDLCTLDNQIVPIKFSASNLSPDMDPKDLERDLIDAYKEILSGIDGLEMKSIDLDRIVEKGDGVDVYFNVDVIRNGQDWKSVVKNALQKEAARNQLLSEVQKYSALDENGETLEWCVNDLGIFTTDCAAVTSYQFAIPNWAIITIAVASVVLLCCLLISCCICARQRARDDDVTKDNFRTYVSDPELWRRNQHEERRRRLAPPRRRRDYKRIAERPQRRHHRDERRQSRHRSSRPRSYSRRWRRSKPIEDVKHNGVHEIYFDEENQRPPLLALPPPQYEYYPRPQAPQFNTPRPFYPPQEQLYAIEGPVYCDDEEVNRPDPPMEAGPILMLTDGRQDVDRKSESSSEENRPYLAIEPPGANWDESESEASCELQWEGSDRDD